MHTHNHDANLNTMHMQIYIHLDTRSPPPYHLDYWTRLSYKFSRKSDLLSHFGTALPAVVAVLIYAVGAGAAGLLCKHGRSVF